jgi:TolA-binding protein
MKNIIPLAVVCAVVAAASAGDSAQQAANEEVARRQYDSGMTFLQNHRDAEALKDLQTVVDSFGTSAVADNALLQIATYQLEIAHDLTAAQTAVDRLLKEYPDTDSAPMAHVLAGRLTVARGRTPADIDTALASYERVPRLFPGSDAVAAAGYYAGDALRLARRNEEALVRFRRVRMEFPRSLWAARAAIGTGYCLVHADRAAEALQEIQWVRQQFPGTAVATEALNLTTLLYRLYLRAPAQPSFSFSGKGIGSERAEYRDVIGLQLLPDGRLLLGHRGGVTPFDAQGAPGTIVSASEPSAFFIDDKKRVSFARNGTLVADRDVVSISVPERDGKLRVVEEINAVLVNGKGERLVADGKGKSVLKVGADGKYIGVFAPIESARLAMNSLEDVAMLDRGQKAVTVVDRDGKPVAKVIQRGTGYELSDPVDIAFDVFDQLYVLDRGKSTVFVFNPKGRLVGSATIPERSPGAFTRAVALAVDPAGRLLIYDERARRIQVYQ